jgi:hypothetical protein
MKLSEFLAGVALFLVGVALFLLCVALFTTTSFLLVFCQKEKSFNNTIPHLLNTRKSGVAADNPALLSAVPIIVPTIISSNSLKQSKESATILYASGKPPKGGDITQPPVNIISPFNNSTVSGTINIPTANDNMGVSWVSPYTLTV